MSTKKTKVFSNPLKVPDINNNIYDRIELNVSSNNVPIDRYWRARFNEGAIEAEVKAPVKKETSVKPDNTPEKEVKKDAN